ncbi:ATP-dependent helicase [Guggenheimella bovis]
MDLSTLNEQQRKAVEAEKGPLLILAGAGSGKTRVLTYRIAHLIEDLGIFPSRILALTFTNKAAREMRERLEKLVTTGPSGTWMGTFHSIAIRILREHHDRIGFIKDFVVYDTADQNTLMKQVLQEMNVNLEKNPAKTVRAIIGQAKSQMLHFSEAHEFLDDIYLEAFELYEKKLRASEAMDFDNILFFLVKLFEENPDVLSYYQDKFHEVLVDEYQDTNRIQYHIVHLLTSGKGNLVVVGDADQSIYGWRGADIRNILDFKKDFPGATIIKLEQNYRSTKPILEAANGVIVNNPERLKKTLWTDKDEGDKVAIYEAQTEEEEAEFIANDISMLIERGIPTEDMAILYRTHAQSRSIEDKLRFRHVPYQIVGGTKFFDRKEIKDLLAYMRVLVNPKDDISFLRALDLPKRGLGDKFIDTLRKISLVEDISLYDSALLGIKNGDFTTRQHNAIKAFIDLFEEKRETLETADVYDTVRELIEGSGYIKMLEESKALEDKTRLENVGELFNDVLIFSQSEGLGLDEYLAKVSLMSEVDSFEEKKMVTMMTLHSSKGLEFPYVWLAGLDDNIFPSFLSKEEPNGLEEERRLCYVGITRAMKRLVLTRADKRFRFGQLQLMSPSIFLDEIPSEVKVDLSEKRRSGFTNSLPFLKRVTTDAEYHAGERVKHPKFGEGVVVSFDQSAKVVQVVFDSGDIKKMHIDYAPLTVL